MRLFTPRKHGVRTACCVRSYLAAVIKLLACEIEPRNTVGTYCSSRRTIYWTLIKCCKTRCTRRVDCNDKKCISFFFIFHGLHKPQKYISQYKISRSTKRPHFEWHKSRLSIEYYVQEGSLQSPST